MVSTILCDDDIAYSSDPISLCKKTLKNVNLKILGLVMDAHPTEEKEATKIELCHRERYLEVRNNESFSTTIIQ